MRLSVRPPLLLWKRNAPQIKCLNCTSHSRLIRQIGVTVVTALQPANQPRLRGSNAGRPRHIQKAPTSITATRISAVLRQLPVSPDAARQLRIPSSDRRVGQTNSGEWNAANVRARRRGDFLLAFGPPFIAVAAYGVPLRACRQPQFGKRFRSANTISWLLVRRKFPVIMLILLTNYLTPYIAHLSFLWYGYRFRVLCVSCARRNTPTYTAAYGSRICAATFVTRIPSQSGNVSSAITESGR